jgi:hypothetical protein
LGPLGNNAIARASLGVAGNGLDENWASLSAVLGWADNVTEDGTNTTTAGLGALTSPNVGTHARAIGAHG